MNLNLSLTLLDVKLVLHNKTCVNDLSVTQKQKNGKMFSSCMLSGRPMLKCYSWINKQFVRVGKELFAGVDNLETSTDRFI